MKPLDPVDRLTATDARRLLKSVREILWPARDPDEQWSPDTIAAIGDLIVELRPQTRAARPSHRRRHAHRRAIGARLRMRKA
jgi:hypothetical protein